MGMDTVRIPVPYFIFGDREPFIGCIEELDKAFNWAERYGLKILIDLHTAPEGQNGFDNGGICGVCKWAQNPDEVEFVHTVLERLAKRYGHREGLWGIEAINEPIMEGMWELFDVPNRYPAVDKEMAKGSGPISQAFLKTFYEEAYFRVRKYMPEEKYFVFHDGFNLTAWKDFMRDPKYVNVVLDTHQYLMVAESKGCEQTLEDYEQYVKENFAKQIKEMDQYFPVICGEWCLFNSLACGYDTNGGKNVFNNVENVGESVIEDDKKAQIYRRLANVQIDAWNQGSGYFYWNYKLLIDTVNEQGWIGWDSWDLDRCVNFGWFPVEKGEETC